MLSFSIQIDINYFQGDPSRLGHPQGLREQHPDDVIEHSTFSSTLTLHIVCFIPCLSQKKTL